MFKRDYTLVQHSILIHFQANQEENGMDVCLRASEVKPKLDRFIVKKLGGHDVIIRNHKEWIRAEHTNGIDLSLNYRMAIWCEDKSSTIFESSTRENRNPDNKLPAIFYGNMSSGQNAVPVKFGVFFNNGFSVRISCFNNELGKEIDNYISEFFAVTNFGTMQSKGFGSFTVKGKEISVAAALKSNYSASSCYIIDTHFSSSSNRSQNELFDTIKQIYSIMKSGQNFVDRYGKTMSDKYIRSFLSVYMHQKHQIGNEKAYMKKIGVAPIRSTSVTKSVHVLQDDLQEFRYIRALLGIGEHIEWIEPDEEQAEAHRERPLKENITIADDTEGMEKIERYASPIFFKIVGSRIFMTADCPDERVFDRTFCFKNKGYTKRTRDISPRFGNMVRIKTLSKDEGQDFSINDFLSEFQVYYNRNISKMKKNYRIEVAK